MTNGTGGYGCKEVSAQKKADTNQFYRETDEKEEKG